MMPKKIQKGHRLSDFLTSDDVLGKDVIDLEGDFIGVSESLYIDPKNFDIVGICVDKGFLKKCLVISKGNIKKITPHAIFLKIKPSFKIKGMKVFDIDGKKIGIVSHASMIGTTNKLKEILVRTGIFKKIVISADYIENVGNNVVLNIKESNIPVLK